MNSDVNPQSKSTNWYEVHGPRHAPQVVLVHGSVVNRAIWQPQIAALRGRYRVLVPDLPGLGALSAEPFHFERAVDLLRELVDGVAEGRAALVGMSLGGHVAALFAGRFPHKVSALVLSGASMNFRGAVGAYARAVGYLMARLVKPDKLYAQAVKNMWKKWPAEVARAQVAGGISPLGASQAFAEIARYDFRAALEGFTAPLLILNGEHDHPNRKGEAAFAAAARGARVAVVSNAGHACSVENPAEYNRILMEFLDRLPN